MSSNKELFEKYRAAKEELEKIEDELFPWIQEICEECTNFASQDMIRKVEIDNDPSLRIRPAVSVSVDNWSIGPDTYHFPVKYLDMTIEEIRADVKKRDEEFKKEQEREKMEQERSEYMRLKKKFGAG